MAKNELFDEAVSKWLEESAPTGLPERVLNTTFERTRRSRQQVGWRALLGRLSMPRFVPALGTAAIVVVAAALALSLYANRPGGIGALPSPTPSASSTVAASPSVEPTAVQLTSGGGTALGWSSDGTRLLVQKGDENLFVLHADGSETQVTEQRSGLQRYGIRAARRCHDLARRDRASSSRA